MAMPRLYSARPRSSDAVEGVEPLHDLNCLFAVVRVRHGEDVVDVQRKVDATTIR